MKHLEDVLALGEHHASEGKLPGTPLADSGVERVAEECFWIAARGAQRRPRGEDRRRAAAQRRGHHGPREDVELLLARGADPSRRTGREGSQTAFEWAERSGSRKLGALLARGSDGF